MNRIAIKSMISRTFMKANVLSIGRHPSPLFNRLPRALRKNRYATNAPPSSTRTSSISPHIGFYQMFGRPIAKVFLLAMVTYQGLHWLWVKLETVEIQSAKSCEIEELQKELRNSLQRAKP